MPWSMIIINMSYIVWCFILGIFITGILVIDRIKVGDSLNQEGEISLILILIMV